MRPSPSGQADTVRVQTIPPSSSTGFPGVPTQNRERLKGNQLLRQHGVAGVITACYVFMLVFLQIGLSRLSNKKLTLSC